MKILFQNARIVDVFTETIREADILVENGKIRGVDNYTPNYADETVDLGGKTVCPGFIDGHIHIESTMLNPYEFVRTSLPHGTTAVIADPHEIANVCGTAGINYVLRASEGLPLDVYVMLPSCVPATDFDESWEHITAEKLVPYFRHPRVLGLAEMMNYVGVISGSESVHKKLEVARMMGKPIDGHAPLLTGRDLDTYINNGIRTDHECTSAQEALERVSKGQWLMIRQGTAARNLSAMLPLFDGPASNRCLLVTDDKEPSDLLLSGHIDAIIRQAAAAGKNVLTAIRMATINAAQCFGLKDTGAIAPGYNADFCVLDDLETVKIARVYKKGELVAENGRALPFARPRVDAELEEEVCDTVRCAEVSEANLWIEPKGETVRAIRVIPHELLTDCEPVRPDFTKNNGTDPENDLLKIAVVERHRYTGHIGLGYIRGIGLKEGAIASTVSHDSHNIIAIGTNDRDMAAAINRLREIGGGNVVVKDGKVIAELRLMIAGLMAMENAAVISRDCERVRGVVHSMGVPEEIAPFMNMAFVSLPVIPHLKLTTLGLVDVDRFELVPLFV